MVVREHLGVYPFCESVLNGGEGTVGVCIGSVSQVLNGGEGTTGYVSVL